MKSQSKFIKDRQEEEEYKMLKEIHETHKKAGIPQVDTEGYVKADYSSPTYEKMGLSKQEAVQIFLEHRYMPRKLLAEKYGTELAFNHEKTKPTNMIQRIYQDIIKKPERYAEFITEDDIKQVKNLVIDRAGFEKGGTNSPSSYGAHKSVRVVVAQPVTDSIEKLNHIRDKAANIVDLKLDSYKSKKDIKSIDLKKAVDVLKTATELQRLERGEATEHVAHYVKEEKINTLETDELINLMNSHRAT